MGPQIRGKASIRKTKICQPKIQVSDLVDFLNFERLLPAFHLGSKEAAILKMLKETRGEMCSLLRERWVEVSKPLTEEEEVMREVEDEAEGRESRRCTGERGSSRPAGQLAGRRGTGDFRLFFLELTSFTARRESQESGGKDTSAVSDWSVEVEEDFERRSQVRLVTSWQS